MNANVKVILNLIGTIKLLCEVDNISKELIIREFITHILNGRQDFVFYTLNEEYEDKGVTDATTIG